MDDWMNDGWEPVAAYPRLPKILTNKRVAKKRKHRELYVSEELLDRPVRLQPVLATQDKAKPPEKGSTAGDGPGAAQQAPKHTKPKEAAPTAGQAQSSKHKRRSAELASEVAIGSQLTWRQQLVQQPAQLAAAAPLPGKAQTGPMQQQQQSDLKQQRKKKRLSLEQQQQDGDASPTAAAADSLHVPGASTAGAKPSKVHKRKGWTERPAQPNGAAVAQSQDASPAGGSGLLQRMRARLAGGHFRQLNQELYTTSGEAAFNLMQAAPQLFQAYHSGFQEQTRRWPVRPVDLALSWLAQQPASWKVADFGCGDAELATAAKQEVVSLDLVATAPGVIACNMAATPLGSASQDAVVFSLALMGTDYGTFLVEAARVLRPTGWLWLAEVRSRFACGDGGGEDFGPFVECLKRLGFKLVSQDASNKMFVVVVLRKRRDTPAQPPAGLQWPPLRPCLYKKR